MTLKLLISAIILCVSANAGAVLEDSIPQAPDPKDNVRRLVELLRDIERRGGDPGGIVADLDRNQNLQQVASSLRSILPDVARLHALRERVSPLPSSMRHRSPTESRSEAIQSSFSPVLWLDSQATYQPNTYFWLQAFSDDAEQDDSDGINGFKSDSRGFTLGFDRELTERWTAGISMTRASGTIESDVFGEDDTTTQSFDLSLSYQRGQHSWNFDVTHSSGDVDRERFMFINTGTEIRRFRLLSDIDTDQTGLSLGYSSFFTRDSGFAVSPFASLRYATLKTDDYQERGINNVSLDVQTDDEEQLVGTIGLSASWGIFGDQWIWSPYVNAAVDHDFKAEVTVTRSRINQSDLRFITEGYDIEETRFRFGAGLSAMWGESLSLSLGYEGHRKGDYHYDGVILNLQTKLH